MRRILVVMAVVAASCLLPVQPSDALVVPCGATINTDTKLTANIVDCATHPAVSISADGVTLDLNGHTVDGTWDPGDPPQTGIEINGHTGVRVKDGIVTDFSSGVDVFADTENVIARLRISSVDVGIKAIGGQRNRFHRNRITADTGISIDGNPIGGDDNVISRNRIDAAFGIFLINGADGNSVVRNRVIDPGVGVFLSTNVTRTSVTRNVVSGGSFGFRVSQASSNRLSKNTAREGGSVGFDLLDADMTQLVENRALSYDDGFQVSFTSTNTVVLANVAKRNDDDGIDVDAEDPGTSIADNIARDNGDLGIEAHPDADDAGGNKASGNGDFRQCTGVACR